MKSLIILTAVFLSSQAFAAKLVCINSLGDDIDIQDDISQIDRPDVIDYLEIVGLLDSEGLLEVREDQPTIGTFVSKPNKIDICRGMNINPDQDPQSPNAGWKNARLDSVAFRVRLDRDQKTGEVTAAAAVPDRAVTFRHCSFIKDADDDEIVRKKMEELSQIREELGKLDQTAEGAK